MTTHFDSRNMMTKEEMVMPHLICEIVVKARGLLHFGIEEFTGNYSIVQQTLSFLNQYGYQVCWFILHISSSTE